VGGEKVGLVARQTWIVFLQAVGDRGNVGIRCKRRWIGERIEPFRDLVRRDLGAFGGNPEAIERNCVRYPRRPDAREQAGNVAAKTVADCFKYRNKIGTEVAVEALKDYLKKYRRGADALWRFAKICRVANVMRPYLEAAG